VRNLANIVLLAMIFLYPSESKAELVCERGVKDQEDSACKNVYALAADKWASQFPKQRKFWRFETISSKEDLDVFKQISRPSNIIAYSLAIAYQSRDVSLEKQRHSLKLATSESGFQALSKFHSAGNIKIPTLESVWYISDWSADGNLHTSTLYILDPELKRYLAYKLIFERDGVKWLLSDIQRVNI
jgi:hypothetical protein